MRNNNGFTLLELSAVLIVLGLVVGGILVGQNLLQAAKMRGVFTQYTEYRTAAELFRLNYNALPGDMDNAEDFWGTAGGAGCPPDAGDPALSGGTCNGNGNYLIGVHGSSPSEEYEGYLFWHHLRLAGYIEGEFSGAPGDDSVWDADVGVNVPSSDFPNGGWIARYRKVDPGDANYYAIDMGNAFVFGKETVTIPHGKLLTPEQAYGFDLKFDDGKPGKGAVIARYWDDQCADADDNEDFESDYRLTDDTIQCALTIRDAI